MRDLDPATGLFLQFIYFHPASANNPAGKVQLGFRVSDLQAFHDELTSQSIVFSTLVLFFRNHPL